MESGEQQEVDTKRLIAGDPDHELTLKEKVKGKVIALKEIFIGHDQGDGAAPAAEAGAASPSTKSFVDAYGHRHELRVEELYVPEGGLVMTAALQPDAPLESPGTRQRIREKLSDLFPVPDTTRTPAADFEETTATHLKV